MFPRNITMKHLAAYLLLGLGGNTSPSASDIEAVLSSVGIDADKERLDKLISDLEGKDINEVGKDRKTLLPIMQESNIGAADLRGYQQVGIRSIRRRGRWWRCSPYCWWRCCWG